MMPLKVLHLKGFMCVIRFSILVVLKRLLMLVYLIGYILIIIISLSCCTLMALLFHWLFYSAIAETNHVIWD